MQNDQLNSELSPEQQQIQTLTEHQRVMETKFDSLVAYVEKTLKDVSRQVGAIDNVAFAALALHEGKEFAVSPEAVNTTRVHIEKVINDMNDYRAKLVAEAQKNRAKEEKAAAKKAATQAKRDERKAKRKGTKNDDTGTEKSN